MIVILSNFKKQKYSKEVTITITVKKNPEFVLSDVIISEIYKYILMLYAWSYFVFRTSYNLCGHSIYVNMFGNLNPVCLLISFVAENFV